MIDADAFAAEVRRARADLAADVADVDVYVGRLRPDGGESWAAAAARVFPGKSGAAFAALDAARAAQHAAAEAVAVAVHTLADKAADLTAVAKLHLAARDAGAAGYTPREGTPVPTSAPSAHDEPAPDSPAQFDPGDVVQVELDGDDTYTYRAEVIGPAARPGEYVLRIIDSGTSGRTPGTVTAPILRGVRLRLVTNADDDAKVRAARARQDLITAARDAGYLAAELDDLDANVTGDSQRRARAEQKTRANPAALAPLLTPMLTGDRWKVARQHGAVPIGKIGDVVPFDPHRHAVLGLRPNRGEPVEILRPGVGYIHEPDTVITKATVVDCWLRSKPAEGEPR